jgi:protein-L-isoaspartate(D-aspartate) O-methyltransferase
MTTRTARDSDSRLRAVRQRFADDLVKRAGIVDFELEERVRNAFYAVPREPFVLPAAVARAYQDVTLPTPGSGMSPRPSYLARILGLIAPMKGDRVLELGSGSGYLSALLAEMGACVFALEKEGLLAQRTRKVLDSFSYQKVLIRTKGYEKGWADHGPYESIVYGQPVVEVPSKVLDQLDPEKGRLIAPIQTKTDIRLMLWMNSPDTGLQRFEFEQV